MKLLWSVLLQAYGDAVVEEAPVFAISTYEVTVFCHRDFTHVRDKRIWASPPIAWDNASLPPRAAWLHFMAVAQDCQDMRSKDLLLRNQVPSTPPSGYPLALPDGEAPVRLNAANRNGYQREGMPDGEAPVRLNAANRNGYQREGMRQQPARCAKAASAKAGTVRQGSSLDVQASSSALSDDTAAYTSSADSMGPALLHHNLPVAAYCTQDALSLWLTRLPLGPLGDTIPELPWIQNDDLTLIMECLASTSLVRVMKVGHMQLKCLCPGMAVLCNVVSLG